MTQNKLLLFFFAISVTNSHSSNPSCRHSTSNASRHLLKPLLRSIHLLRLIHSSSRSQRTKSFHRNTILERSAPTSATTTTRWSGRKQLHICKGLEFLSTGEINGCESCGTGADRRDESVFRG